MAFILGIAYKTFKYTIYTLLVIGFLAGTGIYPWCFSQIDEIHEISPFD